VLGYIAAQLWNKKGSGAQTVREPIIRRATATNASSEMLRDYLHTYKMFLNKYCNDGLNIRISVHVGVASDSNNTDRFNGTQLKFRCCGHPQARLGDNSSSSGNITPERQKTTVRHEMRTEKRQEFFT
jgi:hypothetical protein